VETVFSVAETKLAEKALVAVEEIVSFGLAHVV